jgi:hypothetical protein
VIPLAALTILSAASADLVKTGKANNIYTLQSAHNIN